MDDIKFIIYKLLDIKDAYHYAITCVDNYNIFMTNYLWKYYLESKIDNDTIKQLWDTNHMTTYKIYYDLNFIHSIIREQDSFKDFCNSDHIRGSRIPKGITLPTEIGILTKLDKLKSIQLMHIGLTTIPKEIGQLKNLERLYLGDNKLTSLPSEIGDMENLTILAVQKNNLISIPNSFGKLKKLKTINLRNNSILTVSEELILVFHSNKTKIITEHNWKNDIIW